MRTMVLPPTVAYNISPSTKPIHWQLVSYLLSLVPDSVSRPGHLAGVIVWQRVPKRPLLSTPCVAHSINTCPSGPSKLNRSPYKASHGLMHGTLANIMPSVATASPAHTSTKHCPVTGTSIVKSFSASSKCANTAGSWKPATAFSARVSSRARIPWPPSQYLFLFRGCRSSWPPP